MSGRKGRMLVMPRDLAVWQESESFSGLLVKPVKPNRVVRTSLPLPLVMTQLGDVVKCDFPKSCTSAWCPIP